MKRFLTLLTISLGLIFVYQSCKPDPEEEYGSIYGIVTDKATGEPVKNANVQLRPSGETSLTGNDGRYEFLDLKNGNYSITVSKTGYTDLVDDYVITVEGSKAMRRDVQIEVLPAELRIIDNNGNDIDELDYGSMHDDNSRMFNIFNNGTSSLNYEIIKTAAWITSISPSQGNLQPGATKSVLIIIDRDKLSQGNNVTSISITTNESGKTLTVKANKAGDISTLEAIEITQNSALIRGSVNRELTYSEKGFYYGTDINATNKQTVGGYGIGEYSFNLTNLQEQQTYYYKAYMKVNGETIYGELMSFKTNDKKNTPTVTTTQVYNIKETSASCGGNVTSDGGAAVTAKGVCWSLSQNPTINDNKTNNGSGTGSFTSNITGLTNSTTYYVRAYATNSEGTSYGEQQSFTTTDHVEKPTVATGEISDITQNSAICGGEVVSDGGASVTAKGICWSTSQNPTINSNKTDEGPGAGDFTSEITGLNHNTKYYARAYATNSEGTSYGSVESFTTEDKPSTGEINGHEYVDLGLPSGLKWATCNVGANAPEKYGDHYAWGETATKENYTWDNYSVNLDDINGDISGSSQYDVARKKWGATWRMPKKIEWEELMNNCTWTWTTQNGINGYKVTGPNGSSIFLSAAGYRYDLSLYDAGTIGCYSTSTPRPNNSRFVWRLQFKNNNFYMDDYYTVEYGRSVRPVSE